MEIIAGIGAVTLGFIVAIVVVAFVIGLLVFRSWVKVARADEALVVSGVKQKGVDGEPASSVRVVVNGRAVVNPMTQRHEVISLRSRQVTMNAEAQSEDGVTLDVEAVAIVKIGSDPAYVKRAAERFASQDSAIEVFTTEQLEGALRGVVAKLPVIDLMRDRKRFSEQIATDVSIELEEQGLILDSFQIKGITDDVGYIESLGAPEIQSKRQAAEIAKTNAERAVRQQQITNEEANLVEQTEYDKNLAASKSEVGRANAQALQAEALAKAEAEQQVLKQEAENTQARLDSEVKRVADADLYRASKDADADAYRVTKQAEAQATIAAREAEATRVRAEADAEATRLEGEARGQSIRAEAEALATHQEALLMQRIVDALPGLMAEFAKGYATIGEVTVVSNGGSDSGASGVLANESAVAMRGVFDSVRAATGVDLGEVIQGRAVGRAFADGAHSGDSAHTEESARDESPGTRGPGSPSTPADDGPSDQGR
ncbi:flotillin family protein [Ruania alkalisoli]|uniref:Flotillin family protein n=1 Tax=Ruania alkalisoli TaxID=2779775 RepID=A0A7M1SXU0_9MICO|nr:SPFH domain-containing protein [Ruania alkalisoli]QOR72369.1 flotillin family protein [Ruania alkalisoli]